MSELYHAKFKKKNNIGESDNKNPFASNDSNNPFVTVSKVGKKFRNTVDRIETSSGYQKVQTAKKFNPNSNNKSFTSNTASSIKNVGSSINNKATGYATAAKAAQKIDNFFEDENKPKTLRKKLNKTKLKEIVGPKKRG